MMGDTLWQHLVAMARGGFVVAFPWLQFVHADDADNNRKTRSPLAATTVIDGRSLADVAARFTGSCGACDGTAEVCLAAGGTDG